MSDKVNCPTIHIFFHAEGTCDVQVHIPMVAAKINNQIIVCLSCARAVWFVVPEL